MSITSLTKAAVVNPYSEGLLFFVADLSTSAEALADWSVFFIASAVLYGSPVSVSSLGVAHQTSLRSQPDHDELFGLPVPNGEADCLFSSYGARSHATTLSTRPLRMGFPALPSATAELVVRNPVP